MKWSMDTHKYMSEITRKALQIIAQHGITSESTDEEIDQAEKELASQGVYHDYDSAKGRIRRALFTYFKAYGCLDEHEQLTDVGKAFVENKLSVKELSFEYVLNYLYSKNNCNCYPAQLILTCLWKMNRKFPSEAYITPYDFSQIENCNDISEINDDFVTKCLDSHNQTYAVNERQVGFDVWSKMFVQAGILKRDKNHRLYMADISLVGWILDSYGKGFMHETGSLSHGILENIPVLKMKQSKGDFNDYITESRAVQAYLFSDVNEDIIRNYIYIGKKKPYEDMCNDLGLTLEDRGFYRIFSGLEHLVGYSLASNKSPVVSALGRVIVSVEITQEQKNLIIEEESHYSDDSSDRVVGGQNVILYGVPGAGKSYKIAKEYCDDQSYYERVVFHPDYTYSDFVGQILPKVIASKNTENLSSGDAPVKEVTYEFIPGPFTKVMKKAWLDPGHMYYLIIEELNRGNAPAIFGDIFQLLDRDTDGWGQFYIYNADMSNVIYPDQKAERPVRIPSNLTILATMNTSDQNVFTLDNAFQRRWKMRLIHNNFNKNGQEKHDLHIAHEIKDTGIRWGEFAKLVNSRIAQNTKEMIGSEDKRLGVFFVTDSELDNREDFAEKVLKYLWDDAFKMDRSSVFNEKFATFEDLIDAYLQATGNPLKEVLVQELFNGMSLPEPETSNS